MANTASGNNLNKLLRFPIYDQYPYPGIYQVRYCASLALHEHWQLDAVSRNMTTDEFQCMNQQYGRQI
jgi:hypothetical protein